MSVKNLIIFFVIFFSEDIFSQPVEPSNDYKYVLRIQREVESQVAFYLDEPKTGDLKKIHYESTRYLLSSEYQPNNDNLSLHSERLKSAVGKLISKNYNPNIANPKKRNIRYHYFYIDEFSKE